MRSSSHRVRWNSFTLMTGCFYTSNAKNSRFSIFIKNLDYTFFVPHKFLKNDALMSRKKAKKLTSFVLPREYTIKPSRMTFFQLNFSYLLKQQYMYALRPFRFEKVSNLRQLFSFSYNHKNSYYFLLLLSPTCISFFYHIYQ